MPTTRFRDRLEAHQVALYLGAIVIGLLLGAVLPGTAEVLEIAVEPSIAALLLVTFHGIPLRALGGSLQDRRFLLALLAVNFVAVPLLVLAITRPLVGAPELLVPALLVLLAPCIDYVIVFAALAGGTREQLLGATPLLMLVQMLALPVLVPLLAGGAGTALFSPAPFVRALVLLILLPLLLAALLQRLVPALDLSGAMVPLMVVVLVAVVASQTPGVWRDARSRWCPSPRLPVLATAADPGVRPPGWVREARAVTFRRDPQPGGAPLALALPSARAGRGGHPDPVEPVGMVVLVRLLPRRSGRRARPSTAVSGGRAARPRPAAPQRTRPADAGSLTADLR